MRGHDDSGPIFNCEKDNNDGNFRSLLRFRTLSGDLTQNSFDEFVGKIGLY